MNLDVMICQPGSVPDLGPACQWNFAGAALSPQRLRLTASDRRWQTRWVVARHEGVVGVLPLYRIRSSVAAERIYDPRWVAGSLFADHPADARNWLYVGGMRDLLSGATVAARLSAQQRDEVRRQLVRHAFSAALEADAIPVALYVRDHEAPVFRAALGERGQAVAGKQAAAMHLPPGGLNGYLAQLPAHMRRTIRNDLKAIGQLAFRVQDQEPAAIIPEAARLIAESKQRFGVSDHPLMAAMRLKEWLAGGADDSRAFTLRDDTGVLLGVCFVSRYGTMAEAYEGAVAPGVAQRGLRYAELTILAPLHFAIERGCEVLHLGLDSARPKQWRGAQITPMWTITA